MPTPRLLLRPSNPLSLLEPARATPPTQAARTESEKLRAVGKRNQVAAEAETRRRDAAAASERRRERRAELDRLVAEHESLLKVKAEQEALIAKLSGSSA